MPAAPLPNGKLPNGQLPNGQLPNDSPLKVLVRPHHVDPLVL